MDYDHLLTVTREIGLVLFFVFFVGVLIWVMLPKNKVPFDRASRMAMDDDAPAAPANHGKDV